MKSFNKYILYIYICFNLLLLLFFFFYLFVKEEIYVVIILTIIIVFSCFNLLGLIIFLLNFIILKMEVKEKVLNNDNYLLYFIFFLFFVFFLLFKFYLVLDSAILKLPYSNFSKVVFHDVGFLIFLVIMALLIYILSDKEKGVVFVYIIYYKLFWSFLSVFFVILSVLLYGDDTFFRLELIQKAKACDDISQVINFENSCELMIPSNFQKYDVISLDNFDLISVTLIKNPFILKKIYAKVGISNFFGKRLLNDTEVVYNKNNFYKVFYKNQNYDKILKNSYKLSKNFLKKK